MPDIKTVAQEVASQNQNIMPTQRMTVPPPKGRSSFALDKNKNHIEDMYQLQLRIATIENPLKSINSPISKDNLDTSGVVNLNTGKCTLRFNDFQVGVAIQNDKGSPVDNPYSYSAPDRTLIDVADSSIGPCVPLTYPFVFTNAKNWCGINYIPPASSKVIVGFGKNHTAFILGYLAEHYQAMTPVLMPGEVCISGWGNNYIHWQWSNKIDIVAGATQGARDLDDSSGGKTASMDARCRIAVDGDNGSISLTVNGSGILINDAGVFIQSNGSSSISVVEDSIRNQVKGSSQVSILADSVDMNTSGGVNVNASTYNNNAGRRDAN